MMNSTPPKATRFVVAAAMKPLRKGIYVDVYNQLVELAKLPDPEGLDIKFPSVSAGSAVVKRLNEWALEDGWKLFYFPPSDGSRRIYLQRPETED